MRSDLARMCTTILLVCCLLISANGIPKESFYPHGDTKLPTDQDEVSSPELTLQVPIVFYGEVYNSIYVNSNGLLSFLTEIPSFFNIQFPLDYPVIAPLYTNVDTRGTGAVYYRETQDALLLDRATKELQAAFSSASGFSATSLFIATWWDVGYFKRGTDKINTYQAVIATDGADSYLSFLYADGGIQWIQGSGQSSGLPDARAQAGMVASDSRLYVLRGSGSDQIQNLDNWSNIGQPGVWRFHIGQTGPVGNVDSPDLITGETQRVATPTCREGYSECHSKADCVDQNPGYCCACQRGYYGNGINCLKEGIPIRVNGKVSGIVNGMQIQPSDLQSYVMTADGRTYTAISKIPEDIGFDMQALNVLGGLISWIFAKPVSEAINGYHLTGGILNQTVDIAFKDTGEKITIIQRYTGLDVFDQLRMDTEIRGNVPHIPKNSKIQVVDYEEHYTKSQLGLISSQSTQYYRIGDSSVSYPFTIEQEIRFNECAFTKPDISTIRLKVARNFISYEPQEKIVRYAMTGKVIPLGDDDPCKDGQSKCGHHSSCITEGDNFRCVCNRGYQFLYDADAADESAVCIDVNECTTGTSNCDRNAVCVNEPGSFSCQCQPGFTGDGRSCLKLPTCRDLNCHPDADCISSESGLLMCRCRDGFEGDDSGLHCSPSRASPHLGCDVTSNCSPYATCSPGRDGLTCICLPEYEGDGYSCALRDRELFKVPTCSADSCWCSANYHLVGQECIRDQIEDETRIFARPLPSCFTPTKCVCPRGFRYLTASDTCHPEPGATRTDTMGPTGSHCNVSCNSLNTCHPYAQCIFVAGRHQCQCNVGYEGDGYECSEANVSCLQVDICHIHATCTMQDHHSKATCICNQEYQGDGIHCSLRDECNSDSDCDGNARCQWASQTNRHECICLEGFRREGSLCLQEQATGCNYINNCNANAQCVLSADSKYHCQCNQGFHGDGMTCTALIVGCNVLNNCAVAADCVYSSEASGSRCVCKQGYHGDGTTCIPQQTCRENPSMCGRDANCVLSSRGYHICRCREGMSGNGIICKTTPLYEGNFLLLNQGMATLRIPFKPTPSNPGWPIAIQYYQMAIGIGVDCMNGRVYWSDVTGSTIKSANYNGSDVVSFLAEDISSPEGIAIDWASRNIYWSDSSKDTIEVANLDTKERKVIATNGLVNPRGIAVYPRINKIFWSDWNRAAPKLEWANLDGTGRAVFLEGASVQLPNSLAIDVERDELCWADAGLKKIECVGISSSIKRTVVSNCSYPFGLTITSENYYWTDWDTRKIESAARPSGRRNDPITVPLGGSGKLYGIVAVPETCPR